MSFGSFEQSVKALLAVSFCQSCQRFSRKAALQERSAGLPPNRWKGTTSGNDPSVPISSTMESRNADT